MKNTSYKTFLSYFFWINIVFMIGAFLFLLYKVKVVGQPYLPDSDSVVVQRYAIMITLVGIPLILKMYHSRLKKIRLLEQNIFFRKYFQISLIRSLMLDLVIAFNMIGLCLYGVNNFMFMGIITIATLFFTYPGRDEMNRVEEENELL